jgi:predicted transcriptional regulator
VYGRAILFVAVACMASGSAQALSLGGVTGAVGGLLGGTTQILEPTPVAAPAPEPTSDTTTSAPDASLADSSLTTADSLLTLKDAPDTSAVGPTGDLTAATTLAPTIDTGVPAPEIPSSSPDVALPDAPVDLPLPDLPQLTEEVGLPHMTDTDLQLPATNGIATGPTSPSIGGALPAHAAPSLGTQGVGADMGARKGLGEAFQDWASGMFGASGLAQYIPAEVRAVLTSVWGLLASGLAAIAAYMMGFRYVRSDNLLEHSFRQQLVDLVRKNPGMHLREVARQLNLTTTNASYHLRVLEKHGVIRSEHLNGKRVYFPAAGPEAKRRYLAQAMLHRDARADVLRAVAAHPGTNQSRIASMTSQHQGAVGWHLRRLMSAGLVDEQRTPRECRYQLTALGAEMSQAHTVEAVPSVATA